jgi:MOSC domain-containing protein YiiM
VAPLDRLSVVKVLSVAVGRPRNVEWRAQTVSTSIHKAPVAGPVSVRRLNLDGDEQADLSVHGGPAKAVYAYPGEHYAPWRLELTDADLAWGAFGENLTIEGLLESTVGIGDRLRIGTAELVVTQPRMPCYKLGVRFQRPDMVKRFLGSGRSGFYLAVEAEGTLSAGDTITHERVDAHAITVAEVVSLYSADGDARELLERAVETSALPQAWRDHFARRLSGRGA